MAYNIIVPGDKRLRSNYLADQTDTTSAQTARSQRAGSSVFSPRRPRPPPNETKNAAATD
jgi:hypothetical protein